MIGLGSDKNVVAIETITQFKIFAEYLVSERFQAFCLSVLDAFGALAKQFSCKLISWIGSISVLGKKGDRLFHNWKFYFQIGNRALLGSVL